MKHLFLKANVQSLDLVRPQIPTSTVLPFISISQDLGIFSGVSLYRLQNPQVVVLVHAQDVGLADVPGIVVVDLQPVASAFRKHHQRADANWSRDQCSLTDAMALRVLIGKFVDLVVRNGELGALGGTYFEGPVLIAESQHGTDRLALGIGDFHPRKRFITRGDAAHKPEDHAENWDDSFHVLQV